jgi:hypothetical protein
VRSRETSHSKVILVKSCAIPKAFGTDFAEFFCSLEIINQKEVSDRCAKSPDFVPDTVIHKKNEKKLERNVAMGAKSGDFAQQVEHFGERVMIITI